MPILLYIYLGTEMLAPFFASLLILNSILFLGKLVPFLDVIFNYGIDFADFVRLCAYIIPNLLLFSIPMASMVGVIIAFTKLSNDNEIMALKAAGIGLYRMVPPVVFFAVFTAALTSLTSLYLVPAGNGAMKKMFVQLAKEKIDKGLKEKQFSDGIDDVVLYVNHIAPETEAWQGVYVSDLRQPKTPMTVMAKSGSLDAHIAEMYLVLTLIDGTMHRSLGNRTQTVQFKQYVLNLPLNTAEAGQRPADRVGRKELSLTGLTKVADRLPQKSMQRTDLLIEFHKRLVLPAGCFILSLLGLPLALQSRPGQRAFGFPAGLGLFVLYYVCITGAKGLAESQALPVWACLWLPDLLFGLLALYFIRNAANEKGNPLLALIARSLDRTTNLFKRFRRKAS